MLLTRWRQLLNHTFNTLPTSRKTAPRPGYRPRGSRVEQFEDRTLLTVTVTLDFGFGFPAGGLTIKDADLGSPLNGPTSFNNAPVFGAGQTLISMAQSIRDKAIDVNADGRIDTASDATDAQTLASQVVALVKRSYEEVFDVRVQTASATSLQDVKNTLAAGPAGSHDAYVFVAGAVPRASALFGAGTGISQIDANNAQDNLAFTFADDILPAPAGQNAGALAAVATHEIGHSFGMDHSVPSAGPMSFGDVMGGNYAADISTVSMAARFPLPYVGGGTVTDVDGRTQNHYEVMRIGTGLRSDAPAYVTGTGAFDRIRITRSSAIPPRVDVVVDAFSDPGLNTRVGTFSYTLPAGQPILVEAGFNGDEIILDGNLGTVVTVRGGPGTDRLIIRGNNATSGMYLPDATSTPSDLRGRIYVDSTTIEFQEFEAASSVTVQDVAGFTVKTPFGDDPSFSNDGFLIDSPTTGQNRIYVASRVGTAGLEFVPLTFFNITNVTIDTASNDRDASSVDFVRLVSPGLVAAGLQNFTVSTGNGADQLRTENVTGFSLPVAGGGFTYDAGSGEDKVVAVAAAADTNFTLSDSSLGILLSGAIALRSVSRAQLTGGPGANTFLVSNWSGVAKIDGAGGSDTLSVLGRNVVRDAITIQPSTDSQYPSEVTLGDVNHPEFAPSVIDFANVELLAVAGGNESSSVRPGFPILGDEFTVTPLAGVQISIDGGEPSVPLLDPLVPPPTESLFIDGDRLTLTGEVSVMAGPQGTGLVKVKNPRGDFSVQAVDYKNIEVVNGGINGGFPFQDSSVDAGSSRGDGNPDQFVLTRLGDDLAVLINGAPALRGPLASFDDLTVLGSTDPDTLTIDYSGGDPIPSGGLFFDAGDGSDALNIDDKVASSDHNVTVRSTSVTRQGAGVITYQSVESLLVDSGSFDDVINVLSTAAAMTTVIVTTGGADTVRVGDAGSVQAIQGPLFIANRTGASTLIADNAAEPAGRLPIGHTVAVSDTAISGLSPGAITLMFGQVASVTVSTGNGPDTIELTPSTFTQFSINGNAPTSGPSLDPPSDQPPFADRLSINATGTTGGTLTRTGLGSGNFAFGNRQPVVFTGIENIPSGFLDDQLSEAFDLGVMTQPRSRNGESIEESTDVDMLKFTVAAGQRIGFDIDRAAGSTLDSYIRVFDALGNELVSNNNAAAPGESLGAESYVEYFFATAGTYHVGVSGFGNIDYDPESGDGDVVGSSGGYTIALSVIDTDDQIGEAFPMGAMTQTRTLGGVAIEALTDVDMLSFTVTTGQRISIDLDRPADGTLDSYLRLFNASGTQLAANDDGAALGEAPSLESYLEYSFAAAGTYYLGVSGFDNTNYHPTTGAGDINGGTGGYVVRFSPVVDPDDQIIEAVPLGSMVQARVRSGQAIQTQTDVDMVSFTVTSGQRIGFDLDRPAGSGLDPLLRLFNISGTQLATNHIGTAPGESANGESYLEYTFAAAGTFYLGISGFNNGAYNALSGDGDTAGSMGAYSLFLTIIDLDDQIAEATLVGAITQTRTVAQTLEARTDVDMLRFTVTAGQRIAVDLDRPSGSTLDSYLYLYNGSGTVLASNDDGPTPDEVVNGESYLEYIFAAAGTYYLAVSGYNNTGFNPVTGEGDINGSMGDYTLTVTPVGDPDDQISEAFPMGAVTQTRIRSGQAIERLTDVDMVSFTVTAGQQISFDVDLPVGSSLDSYLRLFNTSSVLQLAGIRGSHLDYVFASAGTYYLGISGFNNIGYDSVTGNGDVNGSAGAYTLRLSVFDADDQLSEAFALGAMNQTRTRSGQAIDTAEDVDMHSLTVAAGQRIAFDIDRPSGSLNSYLRLFDSTGLQLTANDNAAAPGETTGIDSYLEFTFATAGMYFVGISGAPNSTYNAVTGGGDALAATTGAYTLIASVIDIDDQLSEAFSFGAMTQTHTRVGLRIEALTDVDMMSFTVTAGQRIAFDVDRTTGSGLDSYLRVFGSSGVPLPQGANDDGQAPGETSSPDSYLEFTFTAAGTYYVGVSGLPNTTYDPVTGLGDNNSSSLGNYGLTLSIVDFDDQISEAFALGEMTQTRTRTGQAINDAADVDIMSFTVTSGQSITFDVDRPSGTLDSYLRVFNASGEPLSANDNAPAAGEALTTESYLEYTFQTAGTYYVGVSGFNNSTYDAVSGEGDTNGNVGAYTVTLSIVDPDDQISEAFPLGAMTETRTRVGERIETLPDVDMMSFTVTPGQRIAFDIDRPVGSGLDSYLRIFGASGTALGANDDGRAPGESSIGDSYLEITFPSTGTYFVGVSGLANTTYDAVTGLGDINASSLGNYTLTLSVLDLDDQISEAFPLGTLSSSLSRSGQSIEHFTDVDMLSFSVAAGQTVALDIDQVAGSNLDSILRLFNSSGTQLAVNDDGVAPGEATFGESYLEYHILTAGTYYVGVSGYNNSAYNALTGDGDVNGNRGGYTLILSVISDPDDQISEAFPLGAMTQERTRTGQAIERPADVDMMSFTVSAGQRIGFDLDRPSGENLDSFLRLFNSSGTSLAFNDDGAAPGEANSTDSYFEFTFAVAGTYYVGVSGFNNNAYIAVTGLGDVAANTTGSYALTLSIIDVDDQISEAFPLGSITTSVARTGQAIEALTDVDMMSFIASAGQRLSFDLDRPAESLDSILRVFNSSGVQLAFNDDGAAAGEGPTSESYLELTFVSAGTYYIGVSGFDNGTYNATTGIGDIAASMGDYTLTVSVAGQDLDDQISEAFTLGAMTQTRSRSNQIIDPLTDVDMVSFTVAAGQRIGFDIDRLSSTVGILDSYLRVFNSSGGQLAFNDDGAAPDEANSAESYLELTFTSSGTFYVGVSGFNNNVYSATLGTGDVAAQSTGIYAITLTIIDIDDQLNEAFALGSITSSVARTGQTIEVGTDVDMMSFVASAGQRLAFDVDRPSGSLDSLIRVFNSSGAELAFNDDGAGAGEAPGTESYLEFTFASAGTYYIGVSGFDNSTYSPVTGNGDVAASTGAYTLTVTVTTAGQDLDDQISEAFSLGAMTQTRTRISQIIDPPTDVDMMSFTVTAGQRIGFDIDRLSSTVGILDSYLRVFNSSGGQLAFNDDGAAPDEANSAESYLELTFTSSGTFYVGVSGFNNNAYSATLGTGDVAAQSTGIYAITLTIIDIDDQLNEAFNLGPITPPFSRSGQIEPSGDVDMYSFTVGAGQRLSFDIDHPSGSLDSYLRVFDASGTQLAANDDGAAPGEVSSRESYLELTFASAGIYYMGVSGYNNSSYNPVAGTGDIAGSTGPYTLNVTLAPDPDDQISEAFFLGSANNSTRFRSGQSMENGTDVDMMSFTVNVTSATVVIPVRLAFDVDRPSGGVDSYLRLFDSSGSQLAFNDDSAAPGEAASTESYLEFQFTEVGIHTYYVAVSAFNNSAYNPVTGVGDSTGSSTGTYQITITHIANQASVQSTASLPSFGQSAFAATGSGESSATGTPSQSMSSPPQVNAVQSETSPNGLVTSRAVVSSVVKPATEKAQAPITGGLQGSLVDQVMSDWGLAGASLLGWT